MTKPAEFDVDKMKEALNDFIETMENTGGIDEATGFPVQSSAARWGDLGAAYKKACHVLRRDVKYGEPEPSEPQHFWLYYGIEPGPTGSPAIKFDASGGQSRVELILEGGAIYLFQEGMKHPLVQENGDVMVRLTRSEWAEVMETFSGLRPSQRGRLLGRFSKAGDITRRGQ